LRGPLKDVRLAPVHRCLRGASVAPAPSTRTRQRGLAGNPRIAPIGEGLSKKAGVELKVITPASLPSRSLAEADLYPEFWPEQAVRTVRVLRINLHDEIAMTRGTTADQQIAGRSIRKIGDRSRLLCSMHDDAPLLGENESGDRARSSAGTEAAKLPTKTATASKIRDMRIQLLTSVSPKVRSGTFKLLQLMVATEPRAPSNLPFSMTVHGCIH
jgi:hypothetical protein